ncbi:hypothetical protein COO60DRAFT_1535831 [Scenedesmus sp. NREL 46B-D3]|nr:hypothetical protein COO60DRAFT_1535831 [Scenedesmus sp. NREL 46B-D3]
MQQVSSALTSVCAGVRAATAATMPQTNACVVKPSAGVATCMLRLVPDHWHVAQHHMWCAAAAIGCRHACRAGEIACRLCRRLTKESSKCIVWNAPSPIPRVPALPHLALIGPF